MPGREDSTCQRQHRRHGRSHRRRNLKHRFEIIKTLGQGAYGKVKLGVEKETGEAYAIKSIRKKNIGSEHDLSRLRREIEIMASLSHPHIIRIYEVFENSEKIVLVMEYASGGELYDYCNEKQGLYDEEAREFFRQIVSAVHYLHTNGIVHRDLKLENIVLDTDGNIKIADFGFANIYGSEKLLSTFCGSPLYASPEIVNGLPYSGPEVDCWSLGVLLYAMVYGAMPFDSSDFRRLRNQITAGDYFRPQRRSDACEVIGRLLCPNPATRWSIETLSEAWWLNDGYDSNPVLGISSGKPVDHQSLIQKLSGCSSSESDCDLLRKPAVIECESSKPCLFGTEPSIVYESSKPHPAFGFEPTEPRIVPGAPPDQEADVTCASPPIKGILKKPREPSTVCFTEQQEVSKGCEEMDELTGARCKRSRSMDLALIKSVPLRNKHSSQGHTPQRPRSSHITAAVFDSSRRPKKGILKNCQSPSEETGSLRDSLELSFPASGDPKAPPASSATNCTQRDIAPLGTSPEDCYNLEDIEAVLDTLIPETTRICAINQEEAGSSIGKSPDDPSSDSGIVEDVSVDSTYKQNSYKLESSTKPDSPGHVYENSFVHGNNHDQSSGVDLDHSDFAEYTQSVNYDRSLKQSRATTLLTSTPNNLEPTSGRGKRAISKGRGKISDPTWRYSTGSQGSTSSGDILDFSYDSTDAEGTLSEYFSMPLSPSVMSGGSNPYDCSYSDIDLDMLAISHCKPDVEDDDLRATPPPLPERPPPDIQATSPGLPSTLPPLTSPFDISYNDDDVLEQIMWLEDQGSKKFPTDTDRQSPELCWDEVEHIYQQALKLQKEWS